MLFERFKAVKGFVFDVDGVLTDGSVMVTEAGKQLRSFYIKDGYAIQLAVKKGYPVAIISGGRSAGVESRMRGLGVEHIYLNIRDKAKVFREWLGLVELDATEVLYMGDDIPDLDNMRRSGLAACPADAVEEIKAVAAYISARNGGKGAVRDVIEKVMKLQDTWNEDEFLPSA